ncbi:MAG: hypothetical protein P8J78_12270 [Maricaulis sp.]|jgi:hypothetical protein|nr:hypothetical protein [Maricaulis sp.]MDG2045376.1 hypothetical protein [Maricaulis sp.]
MFDWIWGFFDPFRPTKWLGKTVIIGLTYENDDGDLLGREQAWGIIDRFERGRDVVVELKGKRFGEVLCLPPDPKLFKRAPSGEYKLKETAEVLTDPDFLMTAIITHHGEPQSRK